MYLSVNTLKPFIKCSACKLKKINSKEKEKTFFFFYFVFGHQGNATAKFLSRWSGICFMIYDLQFNAAFLQKQEDSFYVEMSSGKSTFLYNIINLTCMVVFEFFDVLNLHTPYKLHPGSRCTYTYIVVL